MIPAALPLAEIHQRASSSRNSLVELMTHHPHLAEQLGPVPSLDMGRDEVRLTFVGQYSSGKSSLINCLTGLDIPVGVDETTLVTSQYAWNGHFVVDTPGARAGTDLDRDRAAEDAVRSSDIVVFTLTVEGFDDIIADLFTSVTELVGSGSLIIVVNKANSEPLENRPGILASLRSVVPEIDQYPLIWTDAHLWSASPQTSAREKERSGIPQLSDLLTDLSVENEAALHMRRRIFAVLDHAQALWGLAGEDPTLLDLLRETEQAIAEIGRQSRLLRQGIRRACQHAERRLVEEFVRLGPDGVDRIDGVIERVTAPESLFSESNVPPELPRGDTSEISITGRAPRRPPDLARYSSAVRSLETALGDARKIFDKEQIRPGTPLHTATKFLLDRAGAEAKPWYVSGRLSRVSRALDNAGNALPLVEKSLSVLELTRQGFVQFQDVQRERHWPREAKRLAAEVSSSLEKSWIATVEATGRERLAPLEASRNEVLKEMAAPRELEGAVGAITEELRGLLGRLDNLQLMPQSNTGCSGIPRDV